ncbi:MAG: TrkH family potassium uptake protein [Desulfobacterales bacterium]
MQWYYVMRSVGAITVCIGLTMLFPLIFSVYYDDGSALPLIQSMAIALGMGLAIYFIFRRLSQPYMSHRNAIAIVTFGWIAATLIGALPFFQSGTFDTFTDCFFESISGFSTTGASVLTDIESVPKGILMWRSLTHWLGGMGIIVLSLAILPFLGLGGMQLYKAEAPGPYQDKLTPRIRDTASALWRIYLALTLVMIILLICGGMDIFDSICHTFGALATGGFSTKNLSIAHYNSAYIDAVITIFMLLAGINFSLHYQMLSGKYRFALKDPELRFFLLIVAIFILVTTVVLYQTTYPSLSQALRYAAFQVSSIITTTGYVTADFEIWPVLPQCILLFCMFLGASAGSTGGGMKCMRIMLLLKHTYLDLFRMIHPRAIMQLKFGKRMVTEDIIKGIWGFFIIYLGLFILASFVLTALGIDLVTSFSAVAACIGNIGPGLGSVGPTNHYAHLPMVAKWILSFCMLLGRLEIYTVIILFVPEFWRK